MKKGNDVLKPGDTYANKDGVFNCISDEGNTCIGCFYEHIDCDRIKCLSNSVILIKQQTSPKPQYPIVLVPGESIEILELNLSVINAIDCCAGCVLFAEHHCSRLCNQIDCSTNSCIISNTIVEVSK